LILVVDDDATVRRVLELLLRRFGYRVLVATSGAEGLALYRARGSEIALVILDVQMPEMSGPATLAALRQINPTVRCWFMSGCPAGIREALASNGIAEKVGHGVNAGVPEVLDKPFCLDRLETLLHAALGSPPPAA
jgi:CheY-like chemotaxis protein